MGVYLVTAPTNPPTEKLVEAANQASARGHVARSLITVAVAKQQDLFRVAKAGGNIEVAGEAAEPPKHELGTGGEGQSESDDALVGDEQPDPDHPQHEGREEPDLPDGADATGTVPQRKRGK